MTAINITFPDSATVPDGTQVTAAHLGIDSFVGTGATWQTDGDRRYILIPAGTITPRFGILSQAALDALTYYGDEYAIRYDLADGQSIPADDSHRVMQVVSGLTQMITLHRSRSSEGGLRCDIDTYNTAAGSDVERVQGGRYIYPGTEIRYGKYFFHDASGHAGVTLDGMEVAHTSGNDFAGVGSMWGFSFFSPVDGAVYDARIYEIRYWTDDSLYDELCPDRADRETLGQKVGWLDQMSMEFGPFEYSGALPVAPVPYATGGITGGRWRFKSSSGTGTGTLTLRDSHAVGAPVRFHPLRSAHTMYFYAPSGGIMRAQFGDQAPSDIIDLIFDGSAGSPTERPIKIGSVETGLVYDQSKRYALVMIQDEREDNAALILVDLTSESTGAARMSGAWWDSGGVKALNQCSITFFDADCEFEPTHNPDSLDFTMDSSYTETEANAVTPILSIANHITSKWDNYPVAGARAALDTGLYGNLPLGRGGQRFTNIDEVLAEYAVFEYLEGARILNPCPAINDLTGLVTPAAVAAEAALMFAACAEYGVRYWGGTTIPLPAGGSNSWGDSLRDDIREVNALLPPLMIAQGRPDLFRWSDVLADQTDGEVATRYFSVGSDDTHFNTDGDQDYADDFRAKGRPLGSSGGGSPFSGSGLGMGFD